MIFWMMFSKMETEQGILHFVFVYRTVIFFQHFSLGLLLIKSCFNHNIYFINCRPLQAKIVREDASRNMYVNAANELEVYSTDEAFEIFYRAQKRKRVAQTQLNSESSRSHSIFTIRVVQVDFF